jgi:hypothetical protein
VHCNENPNYVFLFWELHGFSSNFHIHVSVSALYIPRIGPHIFLQQKRQINRRNLQIAHRHMNVEIGTVAAEFLFWKYWIRIFDIVSLQCVCVCVWLCVWLCVSSTMAACNGLSVAMGQANVCIVLSCKCYAITKADISGKQEISCQGYQCRRSTKELASQLRLTRSQSAYLQSLYFFFYFLLQGGQMKSGQILSHNNSKTVLNIVIKFILWLLINQLFTETSGSTMATGFGPLELVTWTEAERRCAVVMILTKEG